MGFIDEFLTQDLVRENRLFAFDYDEDEEGYRISSREFQEIKRRLLFQLTNFGQPVVEIEDSNFENRGELYLIHRHEGVDLDALWAQGTLRNLFTLWGRPVHLETRVQEQGRRLYSHGPEGGAEKNLEA